MRAMQAIRVAIAACGMMLAMPANAVVEYQGLTFGGLDPMNFFFSGFDQNSDDFISSERSVTYGSPSSGGCGVFAFFGGSPAIASCTSGVFSPHAVIDGVKGDYFTAIYNSDPTQYQQYAFADGAFGASGTYDGTMTSSFLPDGQAQLVVSGAPSAPGPLLGAGLLPALASFGGLLATRLRRRGAASA